MNAHRRNLALVLMLTGGLLLAAQADANRQIRTLRIVGSQEVPANVSTALGTAYVEIDPAVNTLFFHINHNVVNETAAHIHGPAARGVNAGVLFPLPAGPDKKGTWNYTDAQEADLLAGRMYINIHSTAFSGGEIRGQIDSLQIGSPHTECNTNTCPGFALGAGFKLELVEAATETASENSRYRTPGGAPVVGGFVVLLEDGSLSATDTTNWSDVVVFRGPVNPDSVYYISDPATSTIGQSLRLNGITPAQIIGGNTRYIAERQGGLYVYQAGNAIYNLYSDAGVPGIGTKGMVALVLLLSISGIVMLRRRRLA